MVRDAGRRPLSDSVWRFGQARQHPRSRGAVGRRRGARRRRQPRCRQLCGHRPQCEVYSLTMLYWAFLVFYVIVCLLLLVVVLLQQGKGGDIAAAFGGASSQTAFGARAGATVLTRATTILGTLFMLGALLIAILNKSGSGGSVVSGVQAPAAPAQSQPAVPALPKGLPKTAPTPQPGAG